MRIQAPGQSRARWILSVGLGAMVALSASGHALAASSWTDPAGDALFRAPAYADVVAGNVAQDGGTYVFTMTVAAPIPSTPQLTAPGIEALRWAMALDLDPATAPAGWPAAPGDPRSAQALAPEGFMAVIWDGSGFSAAWFDRRPLLTGGTYTMTSVPFEIDGATVTIWLDGDLIGNPTSFRVGFATAAVTVELGTLVDAKQVLDGLSPFLNQWP